MPAKSMYSYSDSLYAILDEFKPAKVFEWGPGTSTQIMALHKSVMCITSVEHEHIFYDMIERFRIPNLILRYEPDMEKYADSIGDETFDFIFIDGRDRGKCLELAMERSPLVMLHDASRADYRDDVDAYPFQIWTDDGNTVTLTKRPDIYERALSCLEKMSCEKPNPEHVYMSEYGKQNKVKV